MFEETVTTQSGRTKRVVAGSKEELRDAVKAVKAEVETKPFDINVPVKKGHDLLSYDQNLVVETVDGTGAHNSPREAIRDDGSVEGSDPMLVVPQDGVNTEVTTKEVVSEGELKDVDLSEVETAADKVGSKASKNDA